MRVTHYTKPRAWHGGSFETGDSHGSGWNIENHLVWQITMKLGLCVPAGMNYADVLRSFKITVDGGVRITYTEDKVTQEVTL